MPLLVCHVGWMAQYEGDEGKTDKIVGGGSWVDEHGFGLEVCNFLRCTDGHVYGHVETVKKKIDRPISIELLGATKNAAFADGVDVVWSATHPQERGRRVIGFYRNARVFRERQHFRKRPSAQHRRDELSTFRIQTDAENVQLIPPELRTVQLGRGKGWIGQANWWFPERSPNRDVKQFLREAHALLGGSASIPIPPKGGGRGKWGGKGDPERKAEVERTAISMVTAHYRGWDVVSVERENLGWDLLAKKLGHSALRLEVKGLFGSELTIGLTPREYRALRDHKDGKIGNYRLCVVTNALTNDPRLTIFRYRSGGLGWVDDTSGKRVSPKITVLEAAIVSLS